MVLEIIGHCYGNHLHLCSLFKNLFHISEGNSRAIWQMNKSQDDDGKVLVWLSC